MFVCGKEADCWETRLFNCVIVLCYRRMRVVALLAGLVTGLDESVEKALELALVAHHADRIICEPFREKDIDELIEALSDRMIDRWLRNEGPYLEIANSIGMPPSYTVGDIPNALVRARSRAFATRLIEACDYVDARNPLVKIVRKSELSEHGIDAWRVWYLLLKEGKDPTTSLEEICQKVAIVEDQAGMVRELVTVLQDAKLAKKIDPDIDRKVENMVVDKMRESAQEVVQTCRSIIQ